MSVVYYVLDPAPGDDLIKIGVSDNVPDRMVGLRRNAGARCRASLALMATEPGGYALERARHSQFAHLRRHGEWFTRTPELDGHIATLLRTSMLPWPSVRTAELVSGGVGADF